VTEQITFRIPSQVDYAYMELTGTAYELSHIDPEMVAALFASVLFSAKQGEAKALDRLKEGLTAVLPASEVRGEVQVQELPEGAAEELLKEELGATEVTSEKPWEQPAPEAGKKPWEKAKPSAKVSINIDDF
jgi:hypothetical protein